MILIIIILLKFNNIMQSYNQTVTDNLYKKNKLYGTEHTAKLCAKYNLPLVDLDRNVLIKLINGQHIYHDGDVWRVVGVDEPDDPVVYMRPCDKFPNMCANHKNNKKRSARKKLKFY